MQLLRQCHPWGVEITGFGRPMGLGVDRHGRLLVTDMDCHVLVRFDAQLLQFQCHDGMNHNWGPLTEVGTGRSALRPSRQPGGWNGPHAVAEDHEGRLMVTCYYTPMVAAVAPHGATQLLIGNDQLKGPATARIDAQGRVLVAEYALNLLMVFDAGGGYLGRMGVAPNRLALKFDAGRGAVPASTAPGGFDRLHMAVGMPDGGFLVADTWNHRLQRLSAEGDFVGCLMDERGWQTSLEHLPVATDRSISCPVALDLNAAGQLLVTAWGSNKVLLLDANGLPVRLKDLPDLNKPYDARFFGDGLVIADSHHGRVLIVDNLASLCE
jgi:outer membrane protein assembly factor BamB